MRFQFLIALLVSLSAPIAFAKAALPVYQVTADLYKDGEKLSASSMTTQEGHGGATRGSDDSGDSNSFVLVPMSSSPDGSRITVEFKFFRKNRGDIIRKRDSVDIKAGETSIVTIERQHSLGPYEIHFTAKRL